MKSGDGFHTKEPGSKGRGKKERPLGAVPKPPEIEHRYFFLEALRLERPVERPREEALLERLDVEAAPLLRVLGRLVPVLRLAVSSSGIPRALRALLPAAAVDRALPATRLLGLAALLLSVMPFRDLLPERRLLLLVAIFPPKGLASAFAYRKTSRRTGTEIVSPTTVAFAPGLCLKIFMAFMIEIRRWAGKGAIAPRLTSACAFFLLALGAAAPPLRAEEPRNRYFFDAYADFYLYHDYTGLDGKNPYLVTPRREGLPSVNLAYVSGEVAAERWRGRVAFQDGTSIDAAYADEDGDWRHVQEAYAGGLLAENLWLDAGIFLSHLSPDSLITFDNWGLSRSLLSDHTALYESGARLQYEPRPDLELSLYALHGWENIGRDGDLAGGWRFVFTKGDWSYRYGGFIGNEDGRRAYNEIIVTGRLSETLEISWVAGAGYQKRIDDEDARWHGASLSLRHALSRKLSAIYRVEIFSDPDSVVSPRPARDGLRAGGLSLALDFALLKGAAAWRNEIRILKSRDDIFEGENGLGDLDSYIATALIISL